MVRMYFLIFCFLLGNIMLLAQNPPCSDFNDPVNPYGNWAPAAAPTEM
jgi:hypothetical protein